MRNFIILVLLIIPFTSIAQKNFRPGYIVNLQGDTTSGLIDYKEWRTSPTSVLFKPATNNAAAKNYGVNDLRFFTINGLESYCRSIVKISLHPININDIGSRDTTLKIDTVFLKLVSYGKIASLLSYTDKLKERFYILEEGQSQPTELIMREYFRGGTTSLVSETGYKDQIISLLNSEGAYTNKLGEKINEAMYDEKDLKKIFALINRSGGTDQAGEKRVRTGYWFAGLGLQKNVLAFNGNHFMSRHPNTSQANWLPQISAGIDLFANPAVGKYYARVEASYQANRSSITTSLPDEKAVYSLSGSTISLRTQFNYALFNSSKLKIPVGAGVVFNYMNITKNQFKKLDANGNEFGHAENWLDLKKSSTIFFGRVSAVFSNKIEASFVYSPSVRLTKTIAYNVSANSVQLQVYYLFRQM